MTEERYKKLISFFSSNKTLKKLLQFIVTVLPWLVVVVYVGMIVVLILLKDMRAIKFIIVPFITLMASLCTRRIINAPRPYDLFDLDIIVKKEKTGRSFPSNHTVSAAIIAFACLYINLWLGAFMILVAAVVAVSRVLAGLHFPKDIFAGIFMSFALAVFGFCLI